MTEILNEEFFVHLHVDIAKLDYQAKWLGFSISRLKLLADITSDYLYPLWLFIRSQNLTIAVTHPLFFSCMLIFLSPFR